MKIDPHCELSKALATIVEGANDTCKDAESTLAYFDANHSHIDRADLAALVSVLNFDAIRVRHDALTTMLAHVG